MKFKIWKDQIFKNDCSEPEPEVGMMQNERIGSFGELQRFKWKDPGSEWAMIDFSYGGSAAFF